MTVAEQAAHQTAARQPPPIPELVAVRVLLYSAGMDSYILRHLWNPHVTLYVNLGTSYTRAEQAMLDQDVTVVDLPGWTRWERPDRIIPLRNLVLVCAGAQYGTDVAIAATAGDRVLDKSHRFAEKTSDLISYLWQPQHWTPGKRVNVVLPVKHLSKAVLVGHYLHAGGDPYELGARSLSCYQPGWDGAAPVPCGACKPCARKWVALTVNGYPDATRSARGYLLDQVVPLIKTGRYGRGEAEERQIMAAVEGRWPSTGEDTRLEEGH